MKALQHSLFHRLFPALLVCGLLVFSLAAAPQGTAGKAPAPAQTVPAPVERVAPFRVGETLTFDVSWASTLSAGTATFNVVRTRQLGNRAVFDIAAEATPGFLIRTLYTILYKMETSIDTKTLLPTQASIFSQERKRQKTKTTRFVSPTSIEYEFKTDKVTRTTKTVERMTYDPLSLFYAVRAMPLTPGQQVTIPITESGKIYRMTLRVGNYEQISSGAGKFRALRLTPSMVDEQGKNVIDRKVSVWISDDSRHLPVRFEMTALVGSIVMSLSRVTG